MRNKNWKLGAAVAGISLYAFSASAQAQEVTGTPPQPAPARQATPAKPARTTAAKSDTESAVATMPTWEAYGSNDPQTLEETFFRLSRDFVSTSELGVRRLGAVPVWPRGDLKFGPVRLMPYLREGVEYESNFYKQPETGPGSNKHGRDAQWSHVNEAALFADTILCGGRMRLSGSVHSIWTNRYDHEKADSWEFDGQVGGSYRWPSGVWVSTGIAWERRNDAADISEINGDFDRVNRRLFFNAGMDRDIIFGSKVQLEAGVATRNADARDLIYDDIDRTETTFHIKASYPFWKKSTRIFALGTYRLDSRQSESINDGNVFGFDMGMEGAIPLREGEYRGLRGSVSIGFQSALYSNDEFTRGADTIIADENRKNTNLHIQAGLQYLASPRTTFDLRYVRTNQFSLRGNYQITDRVDFSCTHNFAKNLVGRASIFGQYSDPSGQVAQETIPGNDYSSAAPNIGTTGAGVGLRYAYNEWMDFDCSFDVENRNAESERSYKNYRGELGVTIYLNALTPRPRSSAR